MSFITLEMTVRPTSLETGYPSLHLLGTLVGTVNQSSSIQVKARKATHVNVRIPHVNLSPPSSTNDEEREDWKTSLDEFHEWLGLACIGSQR